MLIAFGSPNLAASMNLAIRISTSEEFEAQNVYLTPTLPSSTVLNVIESNSPLRITVDENMSLPSSSPSPDYAIQAHYNFLTTSPREGTSNPLGRDTGGV
jgi:hypothetical protein